MPELPKVSQDFTADVSDYMAKIEAMIAANDKLIESIGKVQTAIDGLHGKEIELTINEDEVLEQLAYVKEIIDDAPLDRNINLNVNTQGIQEAVAASEELDDALGNEAGHAAEAAAATDALNTALSDEAREALAAAEATLAEDEALAHMRDEAIAAAAGLTAAADAARDLAAAQLEARATSLDLAAAMVDRIAAETGDEAYARLKQSLVETIGYITDADDAEARLFSVGSEGIPVLTTQAEVTKSLGDAQGDLADDIRNSADSMGTYNDGLKGLISYSEKMVDANRAIEASYKAMSNEYYDMSDATRALGNAAADSIPSWFSWTRQLQTFGGVLTMALGKEVPLVTSIAAWHLVLDSAAEGIIALSGALIALGAAAAGLAPSFLDIYNHLTATRDQIEAFGVELQPFTQFFLNLQHAMQYQAIELYGEAMLDLGKANQSVMTSIENVGSAIDRMGAKISEWVGSNTDFAQTISKGATYARDLGDILGNLIVIIDDLIRADSGIVGFVLGFVSAFTKAITVVLGFSETLDKLLLVTHGFLLWGGLLSSFLINLALVFLRPVASIASFVAGIGSAETAMGSLAEDATPIQKIGAVFTDLAVAAVTVGLQIKTWASGVVDSMAAADGAMATAGAGMIGVMDGVGAAFKALLSQSWLPWVAGIAAVVGAYEGFQQLGSAARTAAAAVQSAVNSMTASGAIDNISSEIGNLNTQIKQVPGAADDAKNSVGGLAQGYAAAGNPVNALADATAHFILNLVSGQRSINAYESEISSLTSQQKTLFQVAGTTMQQNGMTFVQSLGLMDAAGIKSGETFKEDMTQVNGLITGYKDLGVQGGLLNNSINAITLQTEQQESEISKITSAWTNFISLVTGGQSAFDTFGQQMFSVAQALGATSTTLETESGKATVKVETTATSMSSLASAVQKSKTSFNGLSSASLNLQQTFLTGVSDASNQINSLLELSSAAGAGKQGLNEVSQAGKDMVAELLPVAQGSAAATTDLYALAQQAGYTGNDSFKALATWVGNTQNPMANLEGITNKMTIAAGNLATDVQNLANAIDTDLNSAMALAVLSGNKTQTAFNNAATAIKNAHGNITDMLPSIKTLGTSIYQDLGGNIQQTNAELSTFMKAMGLSPGQIKAILSQIDSSFAQTAANVNKNLETIQQEIDSLHGKTITITSQYVTSGGTVPGVTEGIPSGVRAAAGMLVPGTGSGDTVPAMLSPGEAVVPKHLVSALAPFLGANKVPGFAAGGMVAPMTPPAADPTGLLGLQTQIGITTANAATYAAAGKLDQAALTKAQAAMAAAQAALAKDDKDTAALAAATTAAKAVDTKAAATLKAAEAAESTAKSHMTAIEKMKKSSAQEDALAAAKKIYDSDASKVTKDKALLAAAAKLVTTDSSKLSDAKNSVQQDRFTLWQKQIELNAELAMEAQSNLDTANATKQLDALQKIQAGAAGVSSMNSLLLPGTPLATLAAATPGLGLYWGSYDSGGYLPPGLSLAINGTGAPEPVGAAAGPGEMTMHNHIYLDGQQIQQSVQKSTLRYNLRNNGLATGLMKPR